MQITMATGEQVRACPVDWGGCRTQTALGAPSVRGSWEAAGSLLRRSWGSLGLSHLPLQKQQERRRQRARQQELLGAEIVGKHPLQNRYGRLAVDSLSQHSEECVGAGGWLWPHFSSLPRWALWFFKNDKSKMWQANLRLITKFSTVEDFWA